MYTQRCKFFSARTKRAPTAQHDTTTSTRNATQEHATTRNINNITQHTNTLHIATVIEVREREERETSEMRSEMRVTKREGGETRRHRHVR